MAVERTFQACPELIVGLFVRKLESVRYGRKQECLRYGRKLESLRYGVSD